MAETPRDDHEETCGAAVRALREEARALEALPDPPGARLLPFGLIALLLAACHQAAAAEHAAARLAFLVVAGWCHAALSFVGHDCSHGAYSRLPRANRWVGRLVFALCFTSYHGFQAMHAGHHRHTGFDEDPSGDSPALTRRANLLTYLAFVALPLGFPLFAILPGWLAAFGYRPESYPPTLRPHIRVDLAVALAVHAGVGALLGRAGYLAFAAAFLVGVWIVTQVLAFNHYRTASYTSCVLCNTRTVECPTWLQRLLLNGGLHVEHHLAPKLPWYHLPALHARVEARGGSTHVAPSFTAVHLEVLRGHVARWLGR